MYKLILVSAILLVLSISTGSDISKNKSTECDVAEIYQVIEPERGVKALTRLGDLEEVELILVPTKIEIGSYKVEITRKGRNIYKVEGTKTYIETRYCYEYSSYDDAILKVDSNYSYTKGTLSF